MMMFPASSKPPAPAVTDLGADETQPVKVSPYLEMPLRSLAEAEADRERRAALWAEAWSARKPLAGGVRARPGARDAGRPGAPTPAPPKRP